MRNKLLATLLGSTLVIGVITAYIVKSPDQVEIVNPNIVAADTMKDLDINEIMGALPKGQGHIEAVYTDASYNLEELKNNSDAIIKGKVISEQESFAMAVVMKVEVTDTIKGADFKYVYIHQLKNDNILELNKEYTLFLGDQSNESEDRFYIKGGEQGIFYAENNNVVAVHHMMKESLSSLHMQKSMSVKEAAVSVADFDNWVSK